MIVYVCICTYVAYICVLMEAPRNDQATYHVRLDSDCSKVCLSFVIKSLLYGVYLALGAITEMPPAAFVGGYFVVG